MGYFLRATFFLYTISCLCQFAFGLRATSFNATSQSNVVVYFGHSTGNSGADLLDLCSDSNIDVINIGFIRSFTGSAGYPTLDFGTSCKTPTTKVTAANAQISCSTLANKIAVCQKTGKKVMLSIGGSVSDTSFSNSSAASSAANVLWKAFGPTATGGSWRPFGSVVVDGFDFDQESGPWDYYSTFASTFKSLYAAQTTSTLYLSSTYSCAYLSNSTGLFSYLDFVYVRFYNAKKCNVGTTGFSTYLSTWMSAADSVMGSTSKTPMIYMGALAFQTVGSGFVDANTFPTYVTQAQKLGSARFGGIMLWDGTYGQVTKNTAGETYNYVAKEALS